MPHLRIADLLANAPIDPEAHLDAVRVERYAQMLDALPPIVVFDTPEGLLLVDGYHRLAAARLRGCAARRQSKLRCAAARATRRCSMRQGRVLHSVGSPQRRPHRTSSAMPTIAELGALSKRTSENAQNANFALTEF